MRKIRFYFNPGYAGTEYSEIVKYEGDASDDEIEEDFDLWLRDHIEADWVDVEENE